MITGKRAVDTELQRLREVSHGDDAAERTRALRELLRMDWRRAREAVMAALVDAPWSDRALAVRSLAGRADPIAREALPHVEAVASQPSPPDDLVGRALAELAAVVLRHDQTARARALCERSLALVGSSSGVARARARHVLGAVTLRERDHRAALAVLRDAAVEYAALGDVAFEARALDSMGSAHAALHELADAERCYERSLSLKVEADDLAGQAITLGGLGRLAMQRGDVDAAAALFTRDLEIARQLRDDEGLTVMSNQLGEVWLRKALDAKRDGDDGAFRERLASAKRHVDEGVEPARRGGSLRDEGFTLMMQGRISMAEGRHDEAERSLARASEAFALADEPAARHGVELLRAEAARARGDLSRARSHAEAAITAFEELGAIDGQVRGWMELALVFLRSRDGAAQRDALERARALSEALPRSQTTARLDAMRATREVGRLLVERCVVKQPEADALVEAALTTGRSLGALITRAGLLDAAALGAFLRDAMGVAEVTRGELDGASSSPALARLPRRAAERLVALPVGLTDDGALRVAMTDPLDFAARDQLSLLAGSVVQPVYAPDAQRLTRAIRRAYGRWLGLDSRPDAVTALRDLIAHASSQRAADVHLDPTHEDVAVRERVDGTLHEVDRVTLERGAAMASAARAMAGLDEAERPLPRGGSARFDRDSGSAIELRVDTFPTLHGERVAVSLLALARRHTLASLGVDDATARSLARAAGRREGLVLVAGPGVSGRSTVLHAIAAAVDAQARAVVTVEDSLDIPAPEFSRARVSPSVGFDHAAALEGLARQPVDVVLVDELRDDDATRHALALAGSGRLVLAAVRASDVASALAEVARVAGSEGGARARVTSVIALRLLRRLCSACKTKDRGRLDAAWLRSLAPTEDLAASLGGATLYAASTGGCEACGGRGYDGRVLVYEHRDVTAEGDGVGVSLAAAAVQRIADGETSRDEVMRAFG